MGQALEVMLQDDSTSSQTYELYGPTNYSTAEIADLVDGEIVKRRRHFNIPARILKPVADILGKTIWWLTLSSDQVEREFIDQVIDPNAKTFKDLGIEPVDLQTLTYHYLVSLLMLYSKSTALINIHRFYSRDIGVAHIMICLRQLSKKSGRRRSICM